MFTLWIVKPTSSYFAFFFLNMSQGPFKIVKTTVAQMKNQEAISLQNKIGYGTCDTELLNLSRVDSNYSDVDGVEI